MLLSFLGFLLPKYPRERRLLLSHHFSKLTAKLIPAKAQPKSSTLKSRYPVSLSPAQMSVCASMVLSSPPLHGISQQKSCLLFISSSLWPGFTCSRSSEQRAYVLSRFSCVWLLATLWTAARQAPLSTGGFPRQERWSAVSCLPPGNLPDPGIITGALKSTASAGGFFSTSTT